MESVSLEKYFDEGKKYFHQQNFKKATELFADPDFDGDPVLVTEEMIDDEGKTTGEQMIHPEETPEEQETEIMAYVESGMRDALPKQHVLIKAEREGRHREVARVAKAVGQVPDVPLYVAVYEVP